MISEKAWNRLEAIILCVLGSGLGMCCIAIAYFVLRYIVWR